VARANAEAIEACAGVLALLDGSDVDSGTAAEIGFAAALGRPVVGLRTDRRLSGDNTATVVNLQVEYFIHRNGGRVCRGLDEAVAEVHRLVAGGAGSSQPGPTGRVD
jgi:nucleoside 2-deoxyribosyltransferase